MSDKQFVLLNMSSSLNKDVIIIIIIRKTIFCQFAFTSRTQV